MSVAYGNTSRVTAIDASRSRARTSIVTNDVLAPDAWMCVFGWGPEPDNV